MRIRLKKMNGPFGHFSRFFFLLLYPPFFFSQNLTLNMKISGSLLPALLLVASVLVMLTVADIKTTCDYVQDGRCYQSCNAAGCKMECLDSEDYHLCLQVCRGKFPNAFLQSITRNPVISAGKHVTGA